MSPSKGRSALAPGEIAFATVGFLVGLTIVWGGAAQAQPTSVGDRYSSEVYVRPAASTVGPSSGPTLSWPGKTAAAPSRPQPPTIDPRQGYQAEPPQPSAYQTPAYGSPGQQTPQARAYGGPPVMPWYQRFGADSSAPLSGAPASAPAPPRSIYDPPASSVGAATTGSLSAAPAAAMAPSAAPTASAAGAGETARFYSVHRQYGLTPDPDPIPPQFFSRTADLSDPPGPSPVYKAASASGASTTAVHPVQSDDGASSLSQP